jgi:Nickel responsive protein SCO4226-like
VPSYYTVELVCPAEGWGRLTQMATEAREASRQMRCEGTPIRFLRSVFVPEDDVCFLLYEAPTPEAVHAAAGRAGLIARRVHAVSAPAKRSEAVPELDTPGSGALD